MILNGVDKKTQVIETTAMPLSRSEQMSRIRGKNTKPEIFVRSMLHRAG